MKGARAGALLASLVTVLATNGVGASAYTRPGTTTRVSVGPGSRQASGVYTDIPVVSANGRYVAFASDAPDLVRGDTNGLSDIFVRDLWTHKTRLVSVGLGGTPARGSCGIIKTTVSSTTPSISATGRYIAFTSCATNLVEGDVNLNPDVFVRDMKTGRTVIASVTDDERPGLGTSATGFQAISASGRYVTFETSAANFTVPDLNLSPDVYVRDLVRGTTTLVSVSIHRGVANGTSGTCTRPNPAISADGRYVAFPSAATDLVPGMSAVPGPLGGFFNSTTHVYVRDLRHQVTRVADVADDGTLAERSPYLGGCAAPSTDPSISATGRYVAFKSTARNLVPSPGHGWPFATDVYVHDFQTGRTERVDVSSDGEDGRTTQDRGATAGGGEESLDASISASGRYVAFYSSIEGLGQPPGGQNVFLHDRLTGATELVSSPVPGAGHTAQSFFPDTVDGRRIAFFSLADDIVPHDTNKAPDIFLRDRGTELGVEGLHVTLSGRPGFDPAGIARASDAVPDAGPGPADQGADLTGASLALRPESRDVFARIELANMPASAAANPALVYGLDLRVHGVRYEVRANATAGVARFGLFRLEPTGLWTKVTDLRGGYGTTGDEVVVSVPLGDIGLGAGGRLSHVDAFTAIGSYELGPLHVLDRVALS